MEKHGTAHLKQHILAGPEDASSPLPNYAVQSGLSLTPTKRQAFGSCRSNSSGSLEHDSSAFRTPPSVQPPWLFDPVLANQEEPVDLEEFDLDQFTLEEVHSYNAMAEPGQRLQDAISPQKMKELMRKASNLKATSSAEAFSAMPSIPRQVALFARKHPFFEQIMGPFTKSNRRKFERDVYDYAEALGLDHAAAKKQVIKARGFCGEDDFDSDNSALGDEIDSSNDILLKLGRIGDRVPDAMPSIEDVQDCYAELQPHPKPSPRKSPYFDFHSRSMLASKKRKAHPEPQSSSEKKDHSDMSAKRAKKRQCQELTSDAKDDASGDSASKATGGIDTKAAGEAKKKKRKARKHSTMIPEEGQKDQIDTLEPKTATAAHENYLRSNQADPHKHRPTFDQTEKERVEKTEEGAAIVGQIRDDVRFANEKQIDLYDQGKMTNGTQETKDDLVTLKKRLEDVERVEKRLHKSKAKKRKSKTKKSTSKDQGSTGEPQDRGDKKFRESISIEAAVEVISSKCKELQAGLDRAFCTAGARAQYRPLLPCDERNHGSQQNPRSPNEGNQKQRLPCSRCSEDDKPALEYTRKLRSHAARAHSASPAESSNSEHSPLPEAGEVRRRRAKSAKTATSSVPKLRKRSSAISPYFDNPPTKKPNPKSNPSPKISCIPFPPLSSPSFGLMQERLSHSPFHLLLACIFLNKTRGAVALPVFYQLLTRYPTPTDLAAASHEDVVKIFQHLGLQNQRAKKCIGLAKAWCERPPEKRKRYRVLHYPNRGDGKDVKRDEILDEDDERVAWEVGQLPGIGAYAIDSWRIFCRDELRGLPHGLPTAPSITADETITIELQKEWTRVLPLDKELRAYLQWRWLRSGYVWDPLTGEKKEAGREEMEWAEEGGVIYEGEGGGEVVVGGEGRGEWDVGGKGDWEKGGKRVEEVGGVIHEGEGDEVVVSKEEREQDGEAPC